MALLRCMTVRWRPSDVLLSSSFVEPSSLSASSRHPNFVNGRRSGETIRVWGSPALRSRSKSRELLVVRAERDSRAGESPEAVDVSVFRFTLGIAGFDDGDLPAVLGVVFGGLLIVNHFFSGSSITPAQLFTEGVGLVLAALSISLPFFGRQLDGANKVQRKLEPGQKQIFGLADGLIDSHRRELAWVSYNLVRNTSTTAMLVWYSGEVVAARGFWGVVPESVPDVLGFLQKKLDAKAENFSKTKEALYLPGNAGLDFLPRGTSSVVVQPFLKDSTSGTDGDSEGFLLLISNTPGGYRRKDTKWIASLAKKLPEVLSS